MTHYLLSIVVFHSDGVLLQSYKLVVDQVGLHEGEEVVHGGVHAGRHLGVGQVAAVEEAVDAGEVVLVKIRLQVTE